MVFTLYKVLPTARNLHFLCEISCSHGRKNEGILFSLVMNHRSPGSGYGPLAGSCECGDEPSGSGATELVSLLVIFWDKG
jgi:hypothetical protein